MLQFVFGRAASRKTYYIHEEIKKQTLKDNNNLILLVPEQYTFETEKAMLSLLGDGFMSKVNVLSFTRLCETAGQLYGGVAGIKLTDSQRVILLSKALKKLGTQISVFKRYINSTTFIKQLSLLIGEFKMAGVSSDALLKSATELDNKMLSEKISEIALIYATYDNLLKGVYIDPLDELEVFYKKAEQNKFFCSKTVFIDAFKGFTGEQLKVLRLLISQCKDVVISLCCDGEDKQGGVGVFSNICATAEYLKRYAIDCGVQVAEPVYLSGIRHSSPDLKALETLLSGDTNDKWCENNNNVFYGEFSSPLEEIDYTFRKIHNLVRSENYRYEDFVIIARDISKYERRLALASEKFEVPCFLDKRRGLLSSPFARFVVNLLFAANSFDTQSILSMLKTEFFELSDDEISKIEEYTYVWNIDKNTWLSDWGMDPAGLCEQDDKKAEQTKKKLEELNEIRRKIVSPLLKIKNSFGNTCAEVTKTVYETVIKLRCDVTLKKNCDVFFEQNNTDDAEFLMDSWDTVMSVLDDIVRCMGEETVTASEYIEVLKFAMSGTTLGVVPRMIDEVTCGSADRIRPSRPKVVFMLGMNQGEFPAPVSESGILLKADRLNLEKVGIEISDQFKKFAIDEKFLAYSSICSASEKVFVLRHNFEFDGTQKEESTVYSKIKNTFTECEIKDINNYLPETKEDGFEMLAKRYKNQDDLIVSLKKYFENNEDYKWRLDAFDRTSVKTERRLNQDTLEKLFKNDIYLSASKIEVYNKCPFSYFCKHVLKLAPLQKAELNVLQRGTIVHFVLEHVLKEFGESIAFATEEEISDKIHTYMSEYLSNIKGFEYLKIPRFEFLFKEIEKMLYQIIVHISHEFKNSDFKPKAFELSISDFDGDIPALKLDFSPEKRAIITGQIDRVDVLKDTDGNEFVRVIDYKTGSKSFYLADVVYGLNLQMLLYLYILSKDKSQNYACKSPAGILYMPSNRGMQSASKKESPLKMNGMLLNDSKVLAAMDKAGVGDYIPKPPKTERAADPMISKEDFATVFEYVEKQVKNVAKNISNGVYDLCPRDGTESSACKYCDFSHVCLIEDDFEIKQTPKEKNSVLLEKMKEANQNGN